MYKILIYCPEYPWKKLFIYPQNLNIKLIVQNIDGFNEECIDELFYYNYHEFYENIIKNMEWINHTLENIYIKKLI